MEDEQCNIDELSAMLEDDDDDIGQPVDPASCLCDDDDIDDDELDKLACLIEGSDSSGDVSNSNQDSMETKPVTDDPVTHSKNENKDQEEDSDGIMRKYLEMKKKMEELEAQLKKQQSSESKSTVKNDRQMKKPVDMSTRKMAKLDTKLLPKPANPVKHVDTPRPNQIPPKLSPGSAPKLQLLDEDIFSDDAPLTNQIYKNGDQNAVKNKNKPAGFYGSKKEAPTIKEDSDSDWEGIDGEKPSDLNKCGKDIKKMIKIGARERVSHSASYDQRSAADLREKAKKKSETAPKASTSYVASVAGINAVKSGAVSKPKAQVTPSEPFGGVNVIKPLISSHSFIHMTEGRKFIKMSTIHSKVKSPDLIEDWVTVGVIVNKGEPKMSAKGKQFSIWKLSDLFDCDKVVSFFLFNNVYSTHWKTQPGNVIGLLNASVLPNNEKYKSRDNEVSITIDNPKKVLTIGRSRDFGLCKGITKNGRGCSNFINKDKGEFCSYHVQAAYKKQSAKRADLQAGFTGVEPSRFKNAFGSGKGSQSVIYGGKSYSNALSTKKNTERPSINSLVAHQKSATGIKHKVSTIQLQELDQLAVSDAKSSKPDEKNKDFNNLLLTPSCGSMHYVKYMKNDEKIQEKEKNADKKIVPLSAREFLNQHSQGCNKGGKSRAGSSNGILFDLDSMPSLAGKPLQLSKSELKKKRAINIAKAKGGIEKKNPNQIHKKKTEDVENKIKKRLSVDLEGDADDNGQPPKKRVKSDDFDVSSPDVQKLLKATSKYDGALSQVEEEKFEQYFDTLEKTETLEQKMDSVKEQKCILFLCAICKYTALYPSKRCKEEGHKVKRVEGKKRFFRCNNCKTRTTHYDRLPPPCTNCGQQNYERVSMLRERKGPQLPQEKLILRGVEQKNLNSL